MEINSTQTSYVYLGKLLREGLALELKRYDELMDKGTLIVEPVSNTAFVKGMKESTLVLKSAYESLFVALQETMPAALGAGSGEPDAKAIRMVAAEVLRCCIEMRMWEIRNLQSVPAAARLKECRLQLRGYTKPTIDELHRFANYLVAHFSQENPSEPDFEMNLVPGADIKRINKLMDSFIENPEPDPLKRPRTSFSSKVLHYLGVLWVADLFRSERD
tara:strand:+ start:243 stop:896 length:654 start_codon:yes stop_codon:yes gene_type:complete